MSAITFVKYLSASSEVLTSSGWETYGPPLPAVFYVSCLFVVNETTIMAGCKLGFNFFCYKSFCNHKHQRHLEKLNIKNQANVLAQINLSLVSNFSWR